MSAYAALSRGVPEPRRATRLQCGTSPSRSVTPCEAHECAAQRVQNVIEPRVVIECAGLRRDLTGAVESVVLHAQEQTRALGVGFKARPNGTGELADLVKE